MLAEFEEVVYGDVRGEQRSKGAQRGASALQRWAKQRSFRRLPRREPESLDTCGPSSREKICPALEPVLSFLQVYCSLFLESAFR